MSIASAAVRMAACTATDGAIFGRDFDPTAGLGAMSVTFHRSESHERRTVSVVRRFGAVFVTFDDPDAGLRFSVLYRHVGQAEAAARTLVR